MTQPRLFSKSKLGELSIDNFKDLITEVLDSDWAPLTTLKSIEDGLDKFLKSLPGTLTMLQCARMGMYNMGYSFPVELLDCLEPVGRFTCEELINQDKD